MANSEPGGEQGGQGQGAWCPWVHGYTCPCVSVHAHISVFTRVHGHSASPCSCVCGCVQRPPHTHSPLVHGLKGPQGPANGSQKGER